MLLLVDSMAGNAWTSQSTGPESSSGTAVPAASRDEFGTLAVIGKDELDKLRGGFEIGGLQLDIGATIRTFIDGVQVLQSVVTLPGPDGTVPAGGQQSSVSVQSSSRLPGLQIVDAGAGGLAALGDQIPDQVDLGALKGASGVIVNDSKGFTAALHQIDRSQIISALVNTASGRTLRQQVDVTVDIANFRQYQRMVHSALAARSLSSATSR
jgi:hypothetical protein